MPFLRHTIVSYAYIYISYYLSNEVFYFPTVIDLSFERLSLYSASHNCLSEADAVVVAGDFGRDWFDNATAAEAAAATTTTAAEK